MANIILALDTSSSACSVALQLNNDIKALHQIAPMQQAKLLLPMIQEILVTHHVALNQLQAIAFGCGPGSFTGIRIASSVAQGLSFALSCPVIPISSLAATAQAAYEENGWSKVLVAVDARAGNIYCAKYELSADGNMTLIGEESLVSISTHQSNDPSASIRERTERTQPKDPRSSTNYYAVGDAWPTYKQTLTAHFGIHPIEIQANQLPTAQAVLNLANIALKQGIGKKQSFEAIPVYLR